MTIGRVVVDVRALQSAASADRGIGRYTLDLFLALEERHPELVAVYAFEPSLPWHANLRALEGTGKLRPNDHPDVTRAGHPVFHIASLWEITSVEELLPQWVEPGHTSVVATVFDVIPMLFPDIYLREPRITAGYTVRAQALLVMDRLVTISDTTAHDVVRAAGVAPSRVHAIHGGVAAMFVPPVDPVPVVREQLAGVYPAFARRDFLLGPLGIEPRKNLDRLIEAYARLPAELRAAHPLVIQCAARPQDIALLQARAGELGCADDLFFTGFVDDADLVRLYQAAHLVVFPSRYEGLGLPVLEARACGTPVICGDNSALREVMPDERARFDADDVAAIEGALLRALSEPGRRDELAQIPVPERYDWAVVADELASVYRELLARPARLRRPRRPRLAVSSPAPPHYSGPAVYMGLLLAELAEHCDVTLLTPDDPNSLQVDRRVRVERLADLEVIETIEGRFDELVYFLGNSEFHISQSFFHRRRPGSVLLHDARLVGMYREMARWGPHLLPDPSGLVPTLRQMYPGRYDASLESHEYLTNEDVDRLGILMVADVAQSAERLFVHSEHAADLVERDSGRRPEVAFPLPFPAVPEAGEVEEGLVVSFGVLSPVKGSETLVDALAQLDPAVRVAMVGHVDDGYRDQLLARARLLGVEDRLTLTGSVDRAEYLEWLGRAAVAVQLRLTSNGESSAALAEALASGVPTVVSDFGTFRDLPDDLVVKIPVRSGPGEVAAAIRQVLGSAEERSRLADRGRTHAAAFSYASAARELVATLFG